MSELHAFSRKTWRILSMALIVIMIVSIASPFQSGSAYAQTTPVPSYPLNFANTYPSTDPPLGVPSFSWSSVEGAIKYRLQVDNDIAFSAPIVLNITTSNTSYTPAPTGYLFTDGEWYWRVRVEQPTPVGEWSDFMTFTKSWAKFDQDTDNKPGQLSPNDGAILGFFTDSVFSWSPVLGAAKYRFQIALSPDGFADPEFTIDTLTTTHQPNVTNLANGTYYWRVIPMDAADHLGMSSDIRSFELAYGTLAVDLVPTLLEPTDESNPTFTPTFHWEAVEGAGYYRLEYTSEENCDFSVGISKVTRQTSYTPTDTFPNDRRVCWRVRVESGAAAGDWSETWHFLKKWYLQPQLLTPVNGYPSNIYPMFSWTPVPGAAYYEIEIDTDTSFSPPLEKKQTANTTYTPQKEYIGTSHYYWHVTPYDGGGEKGLVSGLGGFQSYYTSTAPILVYPLYYYIPNDPSYYDDNVMNPVEDRTVAYPVFIWNRVMKPFPNGGMYAAAYRLQVSTSLYFNPGDIVWDYDTENTSATPTEDDNFTPDPDQIYYWRVCVLDHMDGDCDTSPGADWSQIWKAHFNPSLALQPTQGATPQLLRPDNGRESVEATPLLEWYPLQGATQYRVEIDNDPGFTSVELSDKATVTIPAYSPWYSLAQRSLDRTDYGTFYWRVQAYVNNAWTGWSASSRFQVASQSEWRTNRTAGNLVNRLLIGDDPVGDVAPLQHDLTSLFASQSSTDWYFGFTATLPTSDMTYVLYIDEDHLDGSGGTTAPVRPFFPTYNVATIPAHQPEYVIYIDDTGSGINADDVMIYEWNGIDDWIYFGRLGEKFGDVYTSTIGSQQYVELRIPNEDIGMSQLTSSASIILLGVDNSENAIVDSVPSDPNAPGTAPISRFSAVSERLNLVSPPSTVSGDPTTIPSFLPFYWDWPAGGSDSSPFAGGKLEIHKDEKYTSLVSVFVMNSSDPYFANNNGSFLSDLQGDNIYYWRVQIRYLSPSEAFGVWTGGWSFRRLGFTPKNLHTSITWATPTFSWDMVEGASTYLLQVATAPDFKNIVVTQETPMTSFTPVTTLAQGVYYWRVQAKRFNGVVNDWSDLVQFTLTLPAPTGLTPDGDTVPYTPHYCWDPIKKYNDLPPFEPILTAWKYRVLVSLDENFSSTYETVDTHNDCWTPSKGYADGTYYWRVAMIDGNGKSGPYSSTASFIKQYPVTELLSPLSGSIPTTPTFIWTPVPDVDWITDPPVVGAATYRFEVSLYNTFYPLYDSVETVNTQFTPTKVYPKDDTYFWRVAIKDRNGNLGPFTGSTIIIGKASYYLPVISR